MADDLKGNKDALFAALQTWCEDCEGMPSDPSDARLLQALWQYSGDHTEACPECDGDCGEPCAPTTAKAAVAALDHFIKEWNKKRGIVQGPG